jgi:tRNA pseudouridine38-40 synthase
MRFFARISYMGTRYFGWQNQPNQISVQSIIEEKLSLVLRHQVDITGCGRTDSGVHAINYFFHFDAPNLPDDLLQRLNRMLPEDIAIHEFIPVHPEAHARFDAISRTYKYNIGRDKNPFQTQTRWHFYELPDLDIKRMQEAASLLCEYREFYPFCKSNSNNKTMICSIKEATWEFDEHGLVFKIQADRFLRGMVRLIVGMCIYVGQHKMTIQDLKNAMETQQRIPQPLSAPPHGLFLCEIQYPFIKTD